MKIKTTYEVDDNLISDLLCSAFEGGVGYWSQIQNYKMPTEKPKLKDPYWKARHTWVPLSKDGHMVLGVDSDEEGVYDDLYYLDRPMLEKGLQKMADKYPRHFNNIVTENFDAETGDVLIQMACFGKIVYG